MASKHGEDTDIPMVMSYEGDWKDDTKKVKESCGYPNFDNTKANGLGQNGWGKIFLQ